MAPISQACRTRRATSSGRQEIALLRTHGSSERAELTVLDANVREVDVAVDDVSDLVTHLLAAQRIGDEAQRMKVRAARLAQHDAVIDARLPAIEASL